MHTMIDGIYSSLKVTISPVYMLYIYMCVCVCVYVCTMPCTIQVLIACAVTAYLIHNQMSDVVTICHSSSTLKKTAAQHSRVGRRNTKTCVNGRLALAQLCMGLGLGIPTYDISKQRHAV